MAQSGAMNTEGGVPNKGLRRREGIFQRSPGSSLADHMLESERARPSVKVGAVTQSRVHGRQARARGAVGGTNGPLVKRRLLHNGNHEEIAEGDHGALRFQESGAGIRKDGKMFAEQGQRPAESRRR